MQVTLEVIQKLCWKDEVARSLMVARVLTSSGFSYLKISGQNAAWVSLRMIENLGTARYRRDTFATAIMTEKILNYRISIVTNHDFLR